MLDEWEIIPLSPAASKKRRKSVYWQMTRLLSHVCTCVRAHTHTHTLVCHYNQVREVKGLLSTPTWLREGIVLIIKSVGSSNLLSLWDHLRFAMPWENLISKPFCSYVQWSRRTGSKFHMNWLSLRNNRLKLKTAGKLPIILEEFIEEYTPI
jgi:hypothetical protein